MSKVVKGIASLQEIKSTVLLAGEEVTEEGGRQLLSAGAMENRGWISPALPEQAQERNQRVRCCRAKTEVALQTPCMVSVELLPMGGGG